MGRKRKDNKLLSLSRIYRKNNRYYLFWSEPLVHPVSGKKLKWHSLCHINDGMLRARNLAEEIVSHNIRSFDAGDMPIHLKEYYAYLLKRRDKKRPNDVQKLKMFLTRNQDLKTLSDNLLHAFHEFNVIDVLPKHIAAFLDSKEDTPRMAQVYRSYLSDFFKYACRKGWCHLNPVENVTVETPEKRQVYLNDADFLKIRDCLLIDVNGNTVPTGLMALAFVDLCYLTAQRTTEIRLLKREQIREEGIYFKPTKTEGSSSADVIIPMTPDILRALKSISGAYSIDSDYVIHTQSGAPFSASGIRSAWRRACERAGIEGVTLKDLRPKAITDAAKQGFKLEQISVTAAHTESKTTKGYIKDKETPVSVVILNIPKE